ncbi:tyrosine-type recombinase/integrase [Arthrobacter sp. ERGS1:01]|uniref:tyrosine-type recombinase/integrase n=1 Tax=Arthrobacter sp. ERGS1:01 TaxID=1704044 RepID=UPI00403FCC25
MEHLTPLMAGRQGSETVFTSESGGRIVHSTFWRKTWIPAVTAAKGAGFAKALRIDDLRHMHVYCLIHEGVPLFTNSRRLGHASTITTEEVYGHLLLQALQDAADAMDRSEQRIREQGDA